MPKKVINFPRGSETPLKDRVLIMKVSEEGYTREGSKENASNLEKKIFNNLKSDRYEINHRYNGDDVSKYGYDRPILAIDLFDQRYRYYHPWGFNKTTFNSESNDRLEHEEVGNKLVVNSNCDQDSNYDRQGWEFIDSTRNGLNSDEWSKKTECPKNSIIVLIGKMGHALLHDVQTGKPLNDKDSEPSLYEIQSIKPHDPDLGNSDTVKYPPPYRVLPNDEKNINTTDRYPYEYHIKPESKTRDPQDMPYKVEVYEKKLKEGSQTEYEYTDRIKELPGTKALLSDLLSYKNKERQDKNNRVFLLLRGRKELSNRDDRFQIDISPYGKPQDYAPNCESFKFENSSTKNQGYIVSYPNMITLPVKGLIDFDSRYPQGDNLEGITEKEMDIIRANASQEGKIQMDKRLGAPVKLFNSINYETNQPRRHHGLCTRDMPCNFIQLCDLVKESQAGEFYGGIDLDKLKLAICDSCEGRKIKHFTRFFRSNLSDEHALFKAQQREALKKSKKAKKDKRNNLNPSDSAERGNGFAKGGSRHNRRNRRKNSLKRKLRKSKNIRKQRTKTRR